MKPFKNVLESDSYNDEAGSERLTWHLQIFKLQFIITKEKMIHIWEAKIIPFETLFLILKNIPFRPNNWVIDDDDDYSKIFFL